MTFKGRLLSTSALLLLLFVSTARQASAAALLDATYTDIGGGFFNYSLTLTNLDPTSNIFDLAVFFAGAGGTTTGTAAGWDPLPGIGFSIPTNFIDWLSLSAASDLAAGTPLGGFSFISMNGPDAIALEFATTSFDAAGNPVDTTAQEAVTSLTAASPTPVPEPSTVLLLASGLVGAWKMHRTRRGAG